jgi:hypothetical protein
MAAASARQDCLRSLEWECWLLSCDRIIMWMVLVAECLPLLRSSIKLNVCMDGVGETSASAGRGGGVGRRACGAGGLSLSKGARTAEPPAPPPAGPGRSPPCSARPTETAAGARPGAGPCWLRCTRGGRDSGATCWAGALAGSAQRLSAVRESARVRWRRGWCAASRRAR